MFHDQAFVLRSQSCVSLSENYSIFGTGKTKLLKMLQHFNLLSAWQSCFLSRNLNLEKTILMENFADKFVST